MNNKKFMILTAALASLLIIFFYFHNGAEVGRKSLIGSPSQNSGVHSRDVLTSKADSLGEGKVPAQDAAKIADGNADNTFQRQIAPVYRKTVDDGHPTGSSGEESDVERLLLASQGDSAKQAVDGNVARSILSSEKFNEAVHSFQEKMVGDNTVNELNDAYRSAIVDQLKGIDATANLSDFACSIQMCIGEIEMAKDQVDAWGNWLKKFTEDKRTPFATLMQNGFVDSSGNSRHRFIISIDPNVNGIRIPSP